MTSGLMYVSICRQFLTEGDRLESYQSHSFSTTVNKRAIVRHAKNQFGADSCIFNDAATDEDSDLKIIVLDLTMNEKSDDEKWAAFLQSVRELRAMIDGTTFSQQLRVLTRRHENVVRTPERDIIVKSDRHGVIGRNDLVERDRLDNHG